MYEFAGGILTGSVKGGDVRAWALAARRGSSRYFPAEKRTDPSMNEPTDLPPLPDRLSTDPRSPHYVEAVLEHDIGIRFNDKDRSDVQEYCISEGWVKIPAARALDRYGQPMLIKLKGKVEPFYR
jgi:hypothetical protein